jgi:hypothetical protein
MRLESKTVDYTAKASHNTLALLSSCLLEGWLQSSHRPDYRGPFLLAHIRDIVRNCEKKKADL